MTNKSDNHDIVKLKKDNYVLMSDLYGGKVIIQILFRILFLLADEFGYETPVFDVR
jgi:hypothetical protein